MQNFYVVYRHNQNASLGGYPITEVQSAYSEAQADRAVSHMVKM